MDAAACCIAQRYDGKFATIISIIDSLTVKQDDALRFGDDDNIA